MPSNKAIIPLYLNTELLNNLFSIVVQEYVEVKSVSTRDQFIVNLKTPMSELSYDFFGKYVQGSIEFQLLNEFTKQRTEQKLSAVISVLKQLRDILTEQNLLKYIDGTQNMDSISVNDFVDFQCQLKRNPVLQHVHDMIDALEVNNIMPINKDLGGEVSADAIKIINDTREEQAKILAFLKEGINSCRNDRCLRYIANNISGSEAKVVVPLRHCCMIENEEYALNGKVRIMGKVVKVAKKSELNNDEAAIGRDSGSNIIYNDNISLMSGTMFDNINFQQLLPLQNNTFTKNLTYPQFDRTTVESNGNLFEVLPILLYI
jgi:hypothetical protein